MAAWPLLVDGCCGASGNSSCDGECAGAARGKGPAATAVGSAAVAGTPAVNGSPAVSGVLVEDGAAPAVAGARAAGTSTG